MNQPMQGSESRVDPAALRSWMVQYICAIFDLKPGNLSTSDSFDSYGLDSVEAVIMAGVMEEEFRVQIDPILFFEHPSIDRFVANLAAPRAGADPADIPT